VAKLAGLPAPVVSRARSVLARLEQGRAATGGIAAGLDDLPLFAAAAAQEETPEEDPLKAALGEVDADALSPREALDLVYRLKRLAAGEG
jgi:DNA mismatch repair protein MutS